MAALENSYADMLMVQDEFHTKLDSILVAGGNALMMNSLKNCYSPTVNVHQGSNDV